MPKFTGASLAKTHGLQVKHSLYRKTGDWYHILSSFPASLFDENGFILFENQREYESFLADKRTGAKQNLDTNTLTVRNGISSSDRYIRLTDLGSLAEEISNPDMVIEGAQRRIVVNSYERDHQARDKCINAWGLNCIVCGFNFEMVFGDIGFGFIHAHHLTPLSSIKKEYVLDPAKDMRPVCPNCHAMLHRRNPPFSIDELKEIKERRSKSN